MALQNVWNFKNELFLETVSWCYNQSPFYKQRFRRIINRIKSLENISALPVLFRDEIVKNHEGIQCMNETPAYVQYTTGTTGNFLQLNRSHAEAHFINTFFTGEAIDNRNRSMERPLFLALTSAWHGTPTPVPGIPFILQAGVYDRTQAQTAKNLLLKEYNFPGVSSRINGIVGSDLLFKALTAYLMAEGVDLSKLGIKQIVLTGGYLSASKKRLLSIMWNATVIDRYSMSEIFGGAREIGMSNSWIFDIEIIPEVVHPQTLKPIKQGIGVLLLTGLYPFMQMMPMVRYHTGDLVQIQNVEYAGLSDTLMVKFLGREKWAVLDKSTSIVVPLLMPGRLLEIIESFPDIAISPRFQNIQEEAGMEITGKPRFEVIQKQNTRNMCKLEIRLGLRYSPWLFPDATASLCTRLRHELYQSFPALNNRILNNTAELELTPLNANEVTPFTMK